MMPPRPFGAPRVSLGVVPPFAALEEMFGIVMVFEHQPRLSLYAENERLSVGVLRGVFRTPDLRSGRPKPEWDSSTMKTLFGRDRNARAPR
jgi:hypothetical protein